jgi:hypothetical protein
MPVHGHQNCGVDHTICRGATTPAFIQSMKHIIFKIKPGKKSIWQAWGEYLHEHESEVLKTLEHENCIFERSVMFERNNETYMVGSMQFEGEPQKADLTTDLNIRHLKIKKECLKGIAMFEGDYHLPAEYQTIYQFDRRKGK